MKRIIQILLGGTVLFITACHFPRRAEDIKPNLPDTVAYEQAHFGMLDKDFDRIGKDTVTIIGTDIFTLHPFFIPKDRRMYMLQIRSAVVNTDKFESHVKPAMLTLIEKSARFMVILIGGMPNPN